MLLFITILRKYTCSCYNNAYFAKVGGISTMEMNYMEREFLFGLNFRLNVTPTEYHSYCTYLQREMCLDYPVILLRSQCSSLSEVDESKNQQKQQITLWDLSSSLSISFFLCSILQVSLYSTVLAVLFLYRIEKSCLCVCKRERISMKCNIVYRFCGMMNLNKKQVTCESIAVT